MKKITAVIPTIGKTGYLDLTIKSILDQSTPFDEIIVFDNSAEQNVKDLSKYSNNEFIKFEYSNKHLSAIESWNHSVSLAMSEFVTIVGDDDILEHNYCENAKLIVEENKFGILKGNIIDSDGRNKGKLPYPTKKHLDVNEFLSLRLVNELSLFVFISFLVKSISSK